MIGENKSYFIFIFIFITVQSGLLSFFTLFFIYKKEYGKPQRFS